jgi:hypothetical protein
MSILKLTKSFNMYANTYFDYLPKEIIDIINEYNADHRPSFNKVLKEFIQERNSCMSCNTEPNFIEYTYISNKRCLFCKSSIFIFMRGDFVNHGTRTRRSFISHPRHPVNTLRRSPDISRKNNKYF